MIHSDPNPTPTHVDLYFDVVSPYAYLLDAVLRREPLPVEVRLHPVLFAGLLEAHDNKGPAEIESKRTSTYELCTWIAQTRGIPFLMPDAHPFNPLKYLRLIIAMGSTQPVVSAVFDALWTTGADAEDPTVWRGLVELLGVPDAEQRIAAPEVKARLRANTEAAVKLGLFGVPTLRIGDRLFWGLDALPMARACIAGDPSLETPAMMAARRTRVGVTRRRG